MSAERSPPVARRDLTLACTVIGAVGGALFGAMFSAPGYRTPLHGWEAILAVAGPTTLTATALGSLLQRRALTAKNLAYEAALFTFAAGAFNGVFILGVVALVEWHLSVDPQLATICVAAMIFGLVAALPFAPAIAAAAHASTQVRARRGSLGEASQRRRLARTVAFSLTLAAVFVPTKHVLLVRLVPSLALLCTLVLLAYERSAVRSIAAEGFVPVLEAADGDAPLDFGVGEQLWARRIRDASYRAAAAAELRLGDREWVERTTRESLRGHAMMAGVALAVLVARCVY